MPKRYGALLSLLEPYEPPPKKKPKRPKPPRPLASPGTHTSPSVDASPSKSPPLAPAPASPSTHTSPSTHATPKRDKGTGDSRITHQFFDDRLAGHPPLLQALYCNLNRYRQGASDLTIVVTWKLLAERLTVHEDTVRRAYHQLRRLGLVEKVRDVYGKSSAQGMIFRVSRGAIPSASASPSTGATHKTKEKENSSLKVSPEDEAEYAAARAALEGRGGG